ncbi:MAG: hypothetical protein IKF52_03330 [Clostridia bacterium]|nr:hypothetical protein [Clostridia bacterium]
MSNNYIDEEERLKRILEEYKKKKAQTSKPKREVSKKPIKKETKRVFDSKNTPPIYKEKRENTHQVEQKRDVLGKTEAESNESEEERLKRIVSEYKKNKSQVTKKKKNTKLETKVPKKEKQKIQKPKQKEKKPKDISVFPKRKFKKQDYENLVNNKKEEKWKTVKKVEKPRRVKSRELEELKFIVATIIASGIAGYVSYKYAYNYIEKSPEVIETRQRTKENIENTKYLNENVLNLGMKNPDYFDEYGNKIYENMETNDETIESNFEEEERD